MAAQEDDSDLFMSVRLDEGRRICKVLVSSQTTGQSVIELLKPDDDKVYCLVEVWKGCERPIAQEEKLQNVLLQWGSDVEDVVFVLKRKHASSRQSHSQKQTRSPRNSPRNSPVPDQLVEKQQKVDSLEKELQQKEKHLKSLRNKESSKNSLKTKYVRLLESRVIEQEEKLTSLQDVQDELFRYKVDNEKLVLELNRLRSMFVLKHQQLAEATTHVEVLSRELAKSSKNQDATKENGLILERNAQYPPYSKPGMQSDAQLNQRLTKSQLLKLQANNGYGASRLNHDGQPPHGKDILFLKHGILHEHDQLNNLLSWQNDEENDTETSADSGHVSNDSPTYQNRLGPSFQFFPNPPEMYCAKVERFDLDQEFDGQTVKGNPGGVGTRDLSGVPEVNGWPQLHQAFASHTKGGSFQSRNSGQGYNQQLFVNTDLKQGGAGPFLRQQHLNRDSPQSTSSLSSLSSESSRNEPPLNPFPGTRSTRPSDTRKDARAKPLVVDNDLRKATSNSNPGSRTTTPTNELKGFLPNEGAAKAEPSRTAGSISHYQRSRGDSIDGGNPLTLGPFKHERSPSQTSDSSTESRRARTPSIERPTPPNTLTIPKRNEPRRSHLSPTVTDATMSPNFNQIKDGTPTSKRRSGLSPTTGPVVQNARSSPITIDLVSQKTKNPTQSLQRNSPMSKERLIPGGSDPGVFDHKGSSSDRTFNTSPVVNGLYDPKGGDPDRMSGPKGRNSPRVCESRVESPASNAVTKPDKGNTSRQPSSQPGVQDLLNDMGSMKVTTREVKPIQIQTRAEKESDNIPVEKTPAKSCSTTKGDAKVSAVSQPKRVQKPPKPLPRKRTKTPPARSFGGETNPVVTSTQPETKNRSREQTTGQTAGTSSEELGTKAYDSILRRGKGGKKSGKRVSLDPHAVLLHASLEGELELVKNIIHQVEDPSYPNNEGLTALHHAVCNSHDDIVKFLVEYGCDINAADMQGWTALHCAAANNSVGMCTFLVNHGACVFAVTAIEGKTPSRCCEKDSENFEQCSSYLSELENNFGLSNEGVVYAVYAYQATRKDELSFECGERLTIVRRGDVTEKEWWWARDTRKQFGYIPRNLLGLHPPVAPDV